MSILLSSKDDPFYETARKHNIPAHGWRISLHHKFCADFKPNQPPTLSQFIRFFTMGIRSLFHVIYEYLRGRKAVMNPFKPLPLKPDYGCPIGGIGCGSIGRGYRGEFTRFCMRPGMYEHNTVKADQFIVTIARRGETCYQSTLSTCDYSSGCLSTWKCRIDPTRAFYSALYPRAWTFYDIPEQKLQLVCQQVSPVIPHNYKDSSLPACAFIWTVVNHGEEEVDVSITFCFKNGTADEGSLGGSRTETRCSGGKGFSVAIHHPAHPSYDCSYVITTTSSDLKNVTAVPGFDACGDGSPIWTPLYEQGGLGRPVEGSFSPPWSEVGVGLCNRVSVGGQSSGEIVFGLCWSMPQFAFGSSTYLHRYSEFFGRGEKAGFAIGDYTMGHFRAWGAAVGEWQERVLGNGEIPEWYKSVLFNELYYISDSGSAWVVAGESAGGNLGEFGRFCYLEGHEYRMYNTFDVHAFASYSFISLWPQLQLSMQHDYAQFIFTEIPTNRRYIDGSFLPVKTWGTMPHDVGNPEAEPWVGLNSYNAFCTDAWRDLNSLFVIICLRDHHFTGNEDHLRAMFPSLQTVMEKQMMLIDDTCLIVSDGLIPDNTFDTLVSVQYGAYVNGLWVAALSCFLRIMRITGNVALWDKFSLVYSKARESFERILFNGEYYDYCSRGPNIKCVFGGQLVGQWLLETMGVGDVFNPQHVARSLDKILELNVGAFGESRWGMVNGMLPDGTVDKESPQSDEIWIGISCSLAALLIHQKRREDGFRVIRGLYERIYQDIGMMFQTPEAIVKTGYYRSPGYMRGLTIWAVQHALDATNG